MHGLIDFYTRRNEFVKICVIYVDEYFIYTDKTDQDIINDVLGLRRYQYDVLLLLKMKCSLSKNETLCYLLYITLLLVVILKLQLQ